MLRLYTITREHRVKSGIELQNNVSFWLIQYHWDFIDILLDFHIFYLVHFRLVSTFQKNYGYTLLITKLNGWTYAVCVVRKAALFGRCPHYIAQSVSVVRITLPLNKLTIGQLISCTIFVLFTNRMRRCIHILAASSVYLSSFFSFHALVPFLSYSALHPIYSKRFEAFVYSLCPHMSSAL